MKRRTEFRLEDFETRLHESNMDTPLEAIERIAKSDDRDQAIIFFLFFSRFEYALKRAGFVAEVGDAKADWTRYAQQRPHLIANARDARFRGAVALLEQQTPKKQVLIDGQLDWRGDRYDGEFTLDRIFTLVRRIRNNLFHGGKFPSGEQSAIERDRNLIRAGIAIMQMCLEDDNQLECLFLEELE